jgi:hypothetical protein
VLRIGLDGRRKPEELRLVDGGRGGDSRQDWLALRQRPGLVEDDDVELTRALERDPGLHQEPVPSAE